MCRLRRCEHDPPALSVVIGPLPAPEGARVCADWEGDESAMAYRSISGAERPITDGLDPVFSCACQFADGSMDHGRIEAPSVYIAGERVSLDGVRALIVALQECLDEIQRWAPGAGTATECESR